MSWLQIKPGFSEVLVKPTLSLSWPWKCKKLYNNQRPTIAYLTGPITNSVFVGCYSVWCTFL